MIIPAKHFATRCYVCDKVMGPGDEFRIAAPEGVVVIMHEECDAE